MAFPDRFTRDADGTLLEIDDRWVNLNRQQVDDVKWGLNFWLSIGESPAMIMGEPGRDVFVRYLLVLGARASLAVTYAFNNRQTVHLANGGTPTAFEPGFLDPLGRVLALTVRKIF